MSYSIGSKSIDILMLRSHCETAHKTEPAGPMTLQDAAQRAGMSRSRVSQLIHGYKKDDRKESYLPVLEEGKHWTYEIRGRRMYTVVTPAGLAMLKRIKAGKVQQGKFEKEAKK